MFIVDIYVIMKAEVFLLATAVHSNQQPSHPAAKQQLQSTTITELVVQITANLQPFPVSSLYAYDTLSPTPLLVHILLLPH